MFDHSTTEGRAQTKKIVSLTMGLLGLGYIGTILVFTFLNGPFFDLLAQVWERMGVQGQTPDGHTFYKALALGNMFMLVAMGYWLWKDPVGNRILLPVVFVSKLSSSTMAFVFFAYNGDWSNLVIPFTDLSQVFMAWFFYKWMKEVAEFEK